MNNNSMVSIWTEFESINNNNNNKWKTFLIMIIMMIMMMKAELWK